MAIDCPGHSDTSPVDQLRAEATRLSVFYKTVPSKPSVYLATNRWGTGVSHPTVVKHEAQETARDHGGRVHVFEEGILTGYC